MSVPPSPIPGQVHMEDLGGVSVPHIGTLMTRIGFLVKLLEGPHKHEGAKKGFRKLCSAGCTNPKPSPAVCDSRTCLYYRGLNNSNRVLGPMILQK